MTDSRELSEKHAIEHQESQCLTPGKMIRSAGLLPERKTAVAAVVPVSGMVSISGSAETRVVDPLTGGEKGSKLARYDLIPPDALMALAEHYGRGVNKYADRNWEKGYKWGLSYAALMRHLETWRSGEDIDAETGSNHLTAVIWHAIALLVFQTRGLGTDDLRMVK